MKIFSFCGWSDSGKTSLITRLISAFRSRGRRVVAVKHVPHGVDFEPEAKDSRQFAEAGAQEVFLFSSTDMIHMRPRSEKDDPFEMVKPHLQADDVVLLEGLCPAGIPVVEVYRPACHPKTKLPFERLAAVVSDASFPAPVPVFAEQNLEGIIRFIEEYHG